MTLEKSLEAVREALEKAPQRNFVESVDIAVNLKNLDLSQPQNRIDEEVVLPNGLGKPVKIAVFARGEVAQQAKKAGAEYVLDPEEIDALKEDLGRAKALADECRFFIAEAQYMPIIGKNLGVVLGPRGKMPVPLTPDRDIGQLIRRMQSSVKLRSRDKMTFHVPVGRRDMEPDKIAENIEAVISKIEQKYEHNIRSVFVKTTMGPAVRVI